MIKNFFNNLFEIYFRGLESSGKVWTHITIYNTQRGNKNEETNPNDCYIFY